MQIAARIIVTVALLVASLVWTQALAASASIDPPAVVQLKPGTLQYWAAGEFTRNGKPVDPPQVTRPIRKPLAIMAHQVSVADYGRCVEDKACPPLAEDAAGANLPAVMVSWRDARVYAAWLSHKLGTHYRLPTDEEWTYAAANRAPDEGPLDRDSDDPAARMLRRYERETRLQPADPTPQPIGHLASMKTDFRTLPAMSGNGRTRASPARRLTAAARVS